MICPKCGFEQADSLECMRCGVIVSRYKGPVVGTTPRPDRAPSPAADRHAGAAPPPLSPAPPPVVATAFGDPAPALAAASGTLYAGPPPAGTIHGGPAAAGTAVRPRVRGSFEVGKILSESFAAYFANFIPFTLLTGLALSPLYLAQAYLSSGAMVMSPAAISLSAVLVLAAAFLCPYIATAAITYGVFQEMRGRDTSIADCLSRGLAALLPVLLLAVIQGLAIFVGFVLCVIPGLLLALRWSVSVPAAVEERSGIFEAMSRSAYLTAGYRGEIFGILFVIGVLNIGSTLLLRLAAAGNPSLFLLLSGGKDLVFVGLSATAAAVMYYRLRSIKESIDVDQIASIFA